MMRTSERITYRTQSDLNDLVELRKIIEQYIPKDLQDQGYDNLKAKCRKRTIVYLRQIYISIALSRQYSWSTIARDLDMSVKNVGWSKKTVKFLLKESDRFRKLYKLISTQVSNEGIFRTDCPKRDQSKSGLFAALYPEQGEPVYNQHDNGDTSPQTPIFGLSKQTYTESTGLIS